MNNFFKCAAITVALISGIAATQAIAQSAPAANVASQQTTDIYNALVNSTDPKATIAALVAAGADVDTVMSIAVAAGVPQATIQAALPNVPAARLQAAVVAALSNPAAFVPATAAGPAAGPAAPAAPAAPTAAPVTAGASNGTSGGGFSGGGGGGGAGAASGS